MKHLRLGLFTIFIFVVFFAAGLFYWWNQNIKPVSSSSEKVRVVIVKGRSASQIANDLYSKGLIKSPLAFKFYMQLTDKASSIQAGEFELSPNLSLFQTVDRLSKAPLQLWVTIPEGLRREEIVEKFIKGLEKSGTDATNFRSDFLKESASIEGQLFPDTYLFPRDATGTQVARRLKDVFNERVVNALNVEFKNSKLTFNEVLTLASIVERETKTKDERPVVSGILLNRIEIGMPLQADATAQYALGNVRCLGKFECDWWKQPTRDDLEVSSPYNTYKIAGLPPSPIANPGLESIKAALTPQESDFLYYIHEPNGTIHYAKTLEEHNKNVDQYLR